MTVTLPSDWNPANGIWPGASMHPTVKDAVKQAATDLAALKTRCDTSMQAKLDVVIARQTAIRTALDALAGKYNSHIGSAGVHVDADSTNTVAAAAATDPTADIIALVNDVATQYEAHRVYTTDSVHGAQDTTNDLTATMPATTEAEAVALTNDLITQYEAHRVLTAGSVHGGADSTNSLASTTPTTDWDDMVAMLNDIKAKFEAHRIFISGSVHGSALDPNAVTAADCGAQITALYAEVNEFKTDVNAHIANEGVHPLAGTANSTTGATTEATAVALINGLKATLNTHIASANDHLDADSSTTPVAGTATEYEDIIAVVVEWRAAYNAHRVLTSLHTKADAVNTGATVGAGGDVTALGTGAAVTIGLVNA